MKDSDKVFYTAEQVKLLQDEIDALRAQVDKLKSQTLIMRNALDWSDYASRNDGLTPKIVKIIRGALNSTPQQCLAEVRAQAVEDYSSALLKKYRFNTVEYAVKCTNRIRQQASNTHPFEKIHKARDEAKAALDEWSGESQEQSE